MGCGASSYAASAAAADMEEPTPGPQYLALLKLSKKLAGGPEREATPQDLANLCRAKNNRYFLIEFPETQKLKLLAGYTQREKTYRVYSLVIQSGLYIPTAQTPFHTHKKINRKENRKEKKRKSW